MATALLLLLGAPAAAAATLPYSLSVSTTSVYSDVGATITVSTNASWFAPGPTALCSFRSLDTPFNSPGLDKYMALKAINATVLNATHLTCRATPVDNAGMAHLTVTMDGGNFSAPSAPIAFFPAVEIATSRRPYVSEANGSLLVRSPPSLAGATLHVTGSLASSAAAGTPLLAGSVSGGGTASIGFDLSALPAAVLEELVVTVKAEHGSKVEPSMQLQKRKIFHRAPVNTTARRRLFLAAGAFLTLIIAAVCCSRRSRATPAPSGK